jgi:hypothetical protein
MTNSLMDHYLRVIAKLPSVILFIISEYFGTGCYYCNGSKNEAEFYPVMSRCAWVQTDDSFNSASLHISVKFKIRIPLKTYHFGMAYGMVYRCFDGTFYIVFDNKCELLHLSKGMLKLSNFLNCDSTIYHSHYKSS